MAMIGRCLVGTARMKLQLMSHHWLHHYSNVHLVFVSAYDCIT